MTSPRQIARVILPFSVRVALLRLRRLPDWLLERRGIARARANGEARRAFHYVLSEQTSPLKRETGDYDPRLQAGKEVNVAQAARRLDGLLIGPNQVFSYHHTVGWPSRLRGFRAGLELQAGKPSQGVGGGCCQVSNLLYILALRSGMKIVERHRHGLDLFPDQDRVLPFGCGATVFYNYADLRFENPLTEPVLLRLGIADGSLRGTLSTPSDPGWVAEVYEVDHRFFRENGSWYRENRIRRRFRRADGSILLDREESHNRGRVLYEPPEDVCGAQL
ncbi:MAG TPA: VanW family protein [Thermoanaerobaculia bacterium]|nr:VanW family protein [Thermoanaerobaculia bacterium]